MLGVWGVERAAEAGAAEGDWDRGWEGEAECGEERWRLGLGMSGLLLGSAEDEGRGRLLDMLLDGARGGQVWRIEGSIFAQQYL